MIGGAKDNSIGVHSKGRLDIRAWEELRSGRDGPKRWRLADEITRRIEARDDTYLQVNMRAVATINKRAVWVRLKQEI